MTSWPFHTNERPAHALVVPSDDSTRSSNLSAPCTVVVVPSLVVTLTLTLALTLTVTRTLTLTLTLTLS